MRDDYGITYDMDVLRLIDEFQALSIGAAEPADDRAVWHLYAVLF